jgi:hypothetical protein
MKICGLKLKIFFICLPFLLSAFLLVGHGAKATSETEIWLGANRQFNYTNPGTTAGYYHYADIAIPTDCVNPFMTVSASRYDAWTQSEMSWNGTEMLASTSVLTLGNNERLQFWYLKNPTVGTHEFRWYQQYYDRPVEVNVWCNVDQDDPFYQMPQTGDYGAIQPYHNHGTTAFEGLGNKLVLETFGIRDYGISSISPTISTTTDIGLWIKGTWEPVYQESFFSSTSTGFNFTITKTGYDYQSSAILAELILNFSPPPQPYTITYTGIGTEQADQEGNFYIPYFWDVCDYFDNIVEVDMWAYFDDTTAGEPLTLISPTLIGPQQCRGAGVYRTNENYSSDLEANGTFKLYMEIDNTEGIEYAESTATPYYALYTAPSTYLHGSGMGFDSSFNQLVDTSTGTSTEVQAMYDFTGLDDWASSTICVYNIKAGVDTDYCFTPTEQSGFASVYLPYSPSNEFDFYFRWHANFSVSADIWDNDHIFHMIWQVFAEVNTVDPLVCQPPIFNLTNVCIDDDTGAELGRMACAIKTAFVYSASALFDPSCNSFNSISKNYEDFKESFPFNVYFELADTMTSAIDIATSSTSTTAAFRVPLIRKTATSTEYYMASGISSTSVSNTIGTSNYSVFYQTVGFIYWILLAFVSYLVLRKI